MTVFEAEYFTAAQAQSLLGRRYRATASYAGVPAGTIGEITGTYAVDRAQRLIGVDVTWEGIPGGSPLELERGGHLTDGFSRQQLFMVFTAGPNAGRRAMAPLDGADDGPAGESGSEANAEWAR